MARARVFGAERVATGHFARVDVDPATGLRRLLRARDRQKDQSYFLFQLDQEQLRRAWFPLGELSKQEVRERARSLGLATADKPESQEICFVPDGDYARVVEEVRPDARGRDGDIVDRAGRVLGRHAGVHRFTIGQRRGLGLASSRPLYVREIDARRRRVVVGPRSELAMRGVDVRRVCWIAGACPAGELRGQAQIRYRHQPASAVIEPRPDGKARVRFDEPVEAVAPGQAAVFYDGDRVLGGGWIERGRP